MIDPDSKEDSSIQEPQADGLVQHLSDKALDLLSQKKFGEQVSYDLPFGEEFFSEKAIYDLDQMIWQADQNGYRNRFGERFTSKTEFLYALETDEAGLQGDEDTVENLRRYIGDCTRCQLCETRQNLVQSEGNTDASLMFVGTSPDVFDDASGRPFMGPAGQLLTKIIEAIESRRSEVFLGYIVRCHPTKSGQLTMREVGTCANFIEHEIAIIQPSVIVALGAIPTRYLVNSNDGFENLRGRFHDRYGAKIMPTYHPLSLLSDPQKKRIVWEDMKKVRDWLAEIRGDDR